MWGVWGVGGIDGGGSVGWGGGGGCVGGGGAGGWGGCGLVTGDRDDHHPNVTRMKGPYYRVQNLQNENAIIRRLLKACSSITKRNLRRM